MEDRGASRTPAAARRGIRAWRIAFVAFALACAVPIASDAYERLLRVNQQARERLILEHRLWELQPAFRGKPETWARFASRLLNDRQLMSRITAKYGAQAEPIELEYRRDLAIARAEVVVIALALWAVPTGLLFALVLALSRRKPAPQARIQPSSASDPRYHPPDA